VIKSFSESLGESGRLDAEYYQSKYDILLKQLSAIKTATLSELVSIKKSIEPGSNYYSDTGIPFVRVNNISKFGISEPEIKISYTTIENIESLYPQKNTILLTKDGTVGIAYKLENNMTCVTSGALLHLKAKKISSVVPDYLTLVLNSLIVQLQAERDAGGSIIQHWKPSEIENVVIPILPNTVQQTISIKVQQSFTLRRQSEQLLERAKQAVEMAIEQGEDTAMKWLKSVKNI
jgi:restriction endonuclease S subunit